MVTGKVRCFVDSTDHLLKFQLAPMEIFPSGMHDPNPHVITVKAPYSFCKKILMWLQHKLLVVKFIENYVAFKFHHA